MARPQLTLMALALLATSGLAAPALAKDVSSVPAAQQKNSPALYHTMRPPEAPDPDQIACRGGLWSAPDAKKGATLRSPLQ